MLLSGVQNSDLIFLNGYTSFKVSSTFTPGYTSEGKKKTNSKSIYSPMFIVALFMIANIWNQTKCSSTD